MALFILRRTGVMILTALCLTFIVFFLTNLYPNLEKLAKTEGNFRMSDEAVASWLDKNGYLQPMPVKYGQWLGVLPGWRGATEDGITGRCITGAVSQEEADNAPRFCGVLQGDWGYSTRFKDSVWNIIEVRLGNTGYLMMWVLIVMIPTALVIGVLAGMREGSVTDRSLSTASILTTATPEYVSGVIFIAVFTSSTVGLKWFKGTANSAMTEPTIENFFLPVITIALYGIGYIARMTRASMTEVMTAQYIRTARLKGVSFPNIVMRHALRNALIAPFTVIMLQFPWLLSGVV
ncbi:MAG: ABC transporter permease, partial [Pseudomonadota bacterium]|nr:ABC transporter permease [Pseudomonadota bacterium]